MYKKLGEKNLNQFEKMLKIGFFFLIFLVFVGFLLSEVCNVENKMFNTNKICNFTNTIIHNINIIIIFLIVIVGLVSVCYIYPKLKKINNKQNPRNKSLF